MSDSLDFTGERFTPECEREIWYEHFHRYALAARWCANLCALDAACGEGYGSALLAQSAMSVDAVDISEQTIAHARKRYADLDKLDFHVANCISLPFPDNKFDRVVSFETLEHLSEHEQLLAEFKRVLKPDGCLILSSPDKAVYSDEQATSNEFHVKELYRGELETLLDQYFPACTMLGQKLMFHSAIWSMNDVNQLTLDQLSEGVSQNPPGITQAPMYYIALCAAEPAYLPQTEGNLYLFDDALESVYQHYHGEIKRNMAAGEIIAKLEKRITELESRNTEIPGLQVNWWRRLLGKT